MAIESVRLLGPSITRLELNDPFEKPPEVCKLICRDHLSGVSTRMTPAALGHDERPIATAEQSPRHHSRAVRDGPRRTIVEVYTT